MTRWWLVALCLLVSVAVWGQNDDLLKLERLGPLQLGMSEAALRKTLGPPPQKGKAHFEAASGYFVEEWKWPARGLALRMAAEKAGGARHLEFIWATSPCAYRTARGIAIGDKRARVETAYRGLIDKESSGDTEILVGSVYGGLAFTIEQGKVSEILIGAFAE